MMRSSLGALLIAIAVGCSRGSQAPAPAPSGSSGAPAASASTLLTAQADAANDAPANDDFPPEGGLAARQWWSIERDRPYVIYVPTPHKVVDKMLAVAKLRSSDVLYDLGCGDGRIVVTAAKKYGVHAVGFDIDPDRIRDARENVRRAGVEDLVTIRQQDIFTVDLSPASVVTLYLLPNLDLQLVPQLEKLAPGARIVSHDFAIEGTVPDGRWTLKASSLIPEWRWLDASVPEDGAHYEQIDHKVLLWVAPLKWAPGADR